MCSRFALVPLIAGIAVGCSSQPKPAGPDSPAGHLAAPPEEEMPANPDAPGKLPMSVVDEHMGIVRGKVLKCAEATTYEGKVTVRVTITPAGAARAVIEHGAGEAAVDDCVLAAFADAAFPASERGQRFAYSFTF
jgi:hypothetical protein